MENVLVSISCATFNQKDFIARAIEGFLMQKTNFNFEIIIHDDASTDGTSDIVREYAKKYPDIIKPIIQTENQYATFKRVSYRAWSQGKGKYVALCEGDDYWTDPLKLQKQVDFMEAYPECSMCFHAAEVVDVTKKSVVSVTRPYNKTMLLPEDELYMGGGNICPSAAILFKREFMMDPPDFYFTAPVGDHPLAMLLAQQGRIGYLDEVMSVRNLWVPNSWNTLHFDDSNQKKAKHLEGMISFLKEFDAYTEKRWEKDINKTLMVWYMGMYTLQGKTKILKDDNIKALIKKQTFITKVKVYGSQLTPGLYKIACEVKLKIDKKLHKVEVEEASKLR
ncbi:glycosyltransferase [Jeotgalibaca sp. A122]|uniref:glycosyltransferase n=1 Tax=Jeotgalibaca sp. A122 TaxID=3457322 RepID=UPI003FD4C34C